MEIKAFASGSTGNGYYISDGETALLLECGITIRQLEIALKFNLSNISGCLVTHEHLDHSKCAGKLTAQGVDIYASAGTLGAINLTSHRAHTVKALSQFTIGSFAILPFDVQHDAAEPLGFLIQSRATGEKLLYFTDTYYLKYKFTGLTHIMGECNYEIGILNRKIEEGAVPAEMKGRLLRSHMSLDTFLNFLRANDLSDLRQVYLVHLSANNSNADYFKEQVQRVTGAEVYVL
jgi:phosphoribosyl 1,2-cyclic phosphodiesterase